jgi:hypothetical protein
MAFETSLGDGVLPGGRLEETRLVFGFESDFARDLRCIPMVVRFKLDRCGIKLTLKQWSRIGRERRFELADMACDTATEARSYRSVLIGLIDDCGEVDRIDIEVDGDPVWAKPARVPDLVAEQLDRQGLLPLAAKTWSRLTTLQRFALVKLSRPGHDNDNLAPALREFGILA